MLRTAPQSLRGDPDLRDQRYTPPLQEEGCEALGWRKTSVDRVGNELRVWVDVNMGGRISWNIWMAVATCICLPGLLIEHTLLRNGFIARKQI